MGEPGRKRGLNRMGGLLPLVLGLPLAACLASGKEEIKQAEIQYDMGVDDLQAGRLPQAMNAFNRALELHSDFARAHSGLGLVLHLLGRDEQALAHFHRALEFEPDFSEVRNNMARIYIGQGRYREAIPLLKKALEDVFLRERYLAESNLGWALFQIGEEEEGFKYVMNALAQNERYCVGYEYLGLMHQKRKAYDEAIRELEQLVKYCPEHASGHRNLAKVLLMAGQLDKGCRHLEICRGQGRMKPVGQQCDRLYRSSCSQNSVKPGR